MQQHFVQDYEHCANIRGTVYFHGVYSDAYRGHMVATPKVIRLVRLLFRKYPFGTGWGLPRVLQYLLGEDYQSFNGYARLRNVVGIHAHISYHARTLNEASGYGIHLTEYEKASEYYCPRIPPNPLLIIMSNLIAWGYLPPDICRSTRIRLCGEYSTSIKHAFATFRYDRARKFWTIRYNEKITWCLVMHLLRDICAELPFPYGDRLQNMLPHPYSHYAMEASSSHDVSLHRLHGLMRRLRLHV
jgi:hypothetical protein